MYDFDLIKMNDDENFPSQCHTLIKTKKKNLNMFAGKANILLLATVLTFIFDPFRIQSMFDPHSNIGSGDRT